MDSASSRRGVVLFVAFQFVVFFAVFGCGEAEVNVNVGSTRKLLQTVDPTESKRTGDSCSKDDIVVYQGATAPLPNGIPTYTVQILNVCLTGCAVSDIHVGCGWFSSARLINPRVFRRIGFDDCLVNGGAALGPGQSLSFQYANTYRYPLYVASVSCY